MITKLLTLVAMLTLATGAFLVGQHHPLPMSANAKARQVCATLHYPYSFVAPDGAVWECSDLRH